MRIAPIVASVFSLLPILAMGQGFGFSDHVYLSPVPRIVSTVFTVNTDLEFLWVGSDVANTNNLSVWVDRIQGAIMGTNQSSTITADANSVVFSGAQRLTNLPYAFPHSSGTFRTVVFIIKPTAGHSATIQSHWVDDATGAHGFLWNQAAGAVRWFSVSGQTLIPNVTAVANIQDWIFTQTNQTATPTLVSYSNSVFSSSVVLSAVEDLRSVGAGSGPANFMFANLYEIRCYSNAVRGLIQSEVDIIHKYATNTYGYTP